MPPPPAEQATKPWIVAEAGPQAAAATACHPAPADADDETAQPDDPDPYFETPPQPVATTATAAGDPTKNVPTLTLAEASARIGPEVLQVLAEKFNGSLAKIRSQDEKDQFF